MFPMATEPVFGIILAIVIGTLAAIVYSLRILVLMERRIARIDRHIEMLIDKVLIEEKKIEKAVGKKPKKK